MKLGTALFPVILASLVTVAGASTNPDALAHEYLGLPDQTLSAGTIDIPTQGGQKKTQRSSGKAAWDSYEKRIGAPLRKWSAEEIAPPSGGTVFYPFSGPDFVTVAQMFPEADRYVLVALQPAGELVDTRAMTPQAASAFKLKFSEEWEKFGALGFFRTADLNENTQSTTARLTSTPVMMAFATALGFRIESVLPLRFNAETNEFETVEASTTKKWSSVRLKLNKSDREVTLDYVAMDLSDTFLKSHPHELSWIRKSAGHPVLLKAASHLLPKPYFSACRAALVECTPLLVQDETGLEYGDLKKMGPVSLYGRFSGVFRLFDQTSQRELAEAYLEAGEKSVLPFAFSYQKSANQRSLQVVRRQAQP